MRLKLDLHDCSSRNIAIMLCLVMALVLISLLFFLHSVCDYLYFIKSTVALYNVLLD